MKLTQLHEAKTVSKYEDGVQQLPDRPKLKQQGDFVWHLYKFFTVDESKSKIAAKNNPEYRKALRQIATEVLSEWQAKHVKAHPKLNDIPISKAVTELVDSIYQSYSGWKIRNEPIYTITVRSNVPKVVDKVNELKQLYLKRFLDNKDRLPPEKIPGKSILRYQPNDDIQAFIRDGKDDDWHHLTEIFVGINQKGEITQSRAKTGHVAKGHPETALITNDAHKWNSAELRDNIKYYKDHIDY